LTFVQCFVKRICLRQRCPFRLPAWMTSICSDNFLTKLHSNKWTVLNLIGEKCRMSSKHFCETNIEMLALFDFTLHLKLKMLAPLRFKYCFPSKPCHCLVGIVRVYLPFKINIVWGFRVFMNSHHLRLIELTINLYKVHNLCFVCDALRSMIG